MSQENRLSSAPLLSPQPPLESSRERSSSPGVDMAAVDISPATNPPEAGPSSSRQFSLQGQESVLSSGGGAKVNRKF